MQFGIAYNTAYYGVDPDNIVACARHAEECGFESFYMPEHIAMYRGARLGSVEIDPSIAIVDPLEGLAFVAAATSRILLGTAVLTLPYHHPVVLAKRLATLDVLSKGRLRMLTVGLGSLRGGAEAVGIDFASRGRRADEAIDVLRLLWTGTADGVSFDGEFFSFRDVVSFPKPHAERPLPIHVGGSTRAAARRAGLRGDGYFPGGAIPGHVRAAQWELVRSTAGEAGRDPNRIEYTRWAPIEMTPERVETYAAQGVTRLVVSPRETDAQAQRAEISAFADRLGLG